MKKIKNKLYRQFLDSGIIQILNEDELERALNNIKGKHDREGRSLLICLYYTGARPNEVLSLLGKNIRKKAGYVTVDLIGSKKGLPRVLYLKYKDKYVAELYKYANSLFPDVFIFYHYRGNYKRLVKTKTGYKYNTEISDKLRYHVKKWFNGVVSDSIPPYYLRHNRFSKLSGKDVSLQDLRMLKGSKTTDSVMSYLHLSSQSAKKIARKMD